ncbi:MAG: hypothetical protein OXN95_01225, partial [bacterium]|nr:hypothetical protein [bacterium]
MTKTKLVFVAMALALVAWVGASAASAQDGPTATADPASVEAAGTYSITLTGSGFMEGTTVSAAACSTGDLDAIDASTFVQLCPLTGTPATDNGDGTFSITMEDVEIGEAGIVFWMGNPLQRDVDTVAVAVGDMGDDDMGDDDMGDDDMGDDDMG